MAAMGRLIYEGGEEQDVQLADSRFAEKVFVSVDVHNLEAGPKQHLQTLMYTCTCQCVHNHFI